MDKATREIIKKLPKVDLHCHIDGSIRTATILDLAKMQGHSLPADNVEDLRPYVRVPADCKCLGDFLKRFEVFYSLLTNAYAMERISYELLRDAAAENVKYMEIRFAPLLQKTDDFSIQEVIEAVLKGVNRAIKEYPIKCGVILCLYRGFPIEDSIETARCAIEMKDMGICGVDVAGDESKYPLREFSEPMAMCREASIPMTIHAGEAGGPENIKDAIDMGAERIGHGVALIKDPKLMEEVIEKKVPLEICLTSNVHTQVVEDYQHHPVKKYIDSGVKVTLNTDDRGVSGIDLSYEFEKALEIGITMQNLIEIIKTGAESAFLDQSEKQELIDQIDAEFKELIQ